MIQTLPRAVQICRYCRHRYHGVAEPSELARMVVDASKATRVVTDVGPNHLCEEILGEGRKCNCDGRTQWWSFTGLKRSDVVDWADRAHRAGYTRYNFGDGYTVVPLDASSGPRDYFMAAVFSDRLEPCATRQEFEDRCALPEHLRLKDQHETARFRNEVLTDG